MTLHPIPLISLFMRTILFYFLSVCCTKFCALVAENNTHKSNNYYLTEKNIGVNISNSVQFTRVPAIERPITF
jgi:hypothetical protein